MVHEHGRSKHEAGPQCTPVPYFLSAKLSRRVGVIPARPSGGAGARRLVDQDVPGHGLYVLEQLATDLGYARIRRARRIQRVQDPTHEGLERLARHHRHEREGHRGVLGRARPRLPVLRQVFPVVRPQCAPGLDPR
jgi:hypothetical protein